MEDKYYAILWNEFRQICGDRIVVSEDLDLLTMLDRNGKPFTPVETISMLMNKMESIYKRRKSENKLPTESVRTREK